MNRNKIVKEKSCSKISYSENEEKRKDEAVIRLIAGLNYLIGQAKCSRLGTAALILHRAKEEMVYWAVDENFHESSKDHFIQKHMLNTETQETL